MTLRHLDLCSGLGGFSLGLELAGGFRTVAFAETYPFCRVFLRKGWPGVPNLGDINELTPADIPAHDIATAGFPCQPFSVASHLRAGQRDDRYLWPALAAIFAAARPAWICCENVAGLIQMALDDICADLEGIGYACWPLVLPACSAGAPHLRERVFILAHAGGDGRVERALPDGAAKGQPPALI